jgi:hypothetical protein
MPGPGTKLSPVVAVGIILCFLIGIGVGAVGMFTFGLPLLGYEVYSLKGKAVAAAGGDGADEEADKAPPKKAERKKGNPKAELETLVTKLDVLTQKPLAVHLDKDQEQKVREQLKGLDTLNALSPLDAQRRLDALLKILQGQREPLEKAGFRWPQEKEAEAPGDPRMRPPNPFRAEPAAGHLRSLEARLGKAGS